MRWIGAATLIGALCAPLAARASETINYTYDARGRLITVAHSGTVNSNLTVQYTYDAAGNRTHVTTTGANQTAPNAKRTSGATTTKAK